MVACCFSDKISVRLEESLKENVFGQHIVANLVPKALRAHIKKKEPQKALVIRCDPSSLS